MTPFQEAVKGLNPRQVAYCTHRVAGIAQKEAYIKAGYKESANKWTLDVSIARMEKLPKIKLAIVKMQELANARSEITREDLCMHLMEHRQYAFDEGQIGAANQAVMGVAKIMGLEINRSEVKHTHSYEVEQATQELFGMLSRRGKLEKKDKQIIDVTPNDTE